MTVYVCQVLDEDIIEMHLAHPQPPLRTIEVEAPPFVAFTPKSSPSNWQAAAELGFVGIFLHFLH